MSGKTPQLLKWFSTSQWNKYEHELLVKNIMDYIKMYQQLAESEQEENVDLALENVNKIAESSLKGETPKNLKKSLLMMIS